MRKDAVFVNAVCKAEEVNLLSPEAMLRLSAAEFADAVKMLHDYGYNEGVYTEGSFDIDRFIGRQVQLLIEFIKEYAPSEEVEQFLIAPFLFNDIKAEYKRKRGGVSAKQYDNKLGVAEGDYSRLDEEVNKTLVELDGLEPDSQTIDLALTKAMYAYKLKKAKRNGLLCKYVRAEIDMINIITAIRAQNLGLGEEKRNELFVEGGTLKSPTVTKEALPKEYKDFDLGNLVKLEAQTDNYLLKIADSKSDNMDSVGPLLSFVLRKHSEFKTVKMILVCIKSDARSDIPHRIRGLL